MHHCSDRLYKDMVICFTKLGYNYNKFAKLKVIIISTVVKTRNLTKTYVMGKIPVHALDGININIEEGELISIFGPSGSGKTTLLNMIGALDRPTSGSVFLAGKDISKMKKNELAKQRQKIGFVFQFYNLIPRFSALKNVEFSMNIQKIPKQERYKIARNLLDRVGLRSRINHKPSELSGGEQQRVAIARALAQDPNFLLMDEPTGNVDTKTRDNIMTLVQELNKEQDLTVIIVTHNPFIAKTTNRILPIIDGKISDQFSIEEYERLIPSKRSIQKKQLKEKK